ncbi:hypothetical protein FRC01_001601 [Tulasnella sp. 417]|nr:hypothetical protein FRC01_001601 [Tulasnella sp. 417]
MSRGGFGNKSSLKVASSQSVQTPSPISSPTQSTSSFSSQETIKASRFSTKTILKELVGGGGNNRSVPKLPKSERVYTSGRGGARKGPKSLSYIGPSNAEKLDALLSNSNREPQCLAPETATVSSFATSHSGSLESDHSSATVKRAVMEVLGGGGNEHGLWRQGPEFIRSYGRGGSYRSPTTSSFTSRASSDIEILSEGYSDSSSLSVARNAHGLFFFGRGRRSSEDAPDTGSFLVVGPGKGIIHPSANSKTHPTPLSSDSALTRSSMHKSGMSKISVKVAVKEVLGGGGNDDGEWKYIDVFYPGYGRGGEGARFSNSIRDLYDIFYPCPHFSGRHYWYHNPNEHPRLRHNSDSTISFPSISSDTSSVYAPSMMSSGGTSWVSSTGDDEEDTCSSWSIAQAYLAGPNNHLAGLEHHDLAAPNRLLETNADYHQTRPAGSPMPFIQDYYQAGFPENERGRAMSEGAEAVHSPQLVNFRRSLQAERQRKEDPRTVERTLRERARRAKQSIEHKASAGTPTNRTVDHVPPPPSHQPPSLPPTASIRYSYKTSPGLPAERVATFLPTQLPPSTFPEIEPDEDLRLDAIGRSLASALALVQARSEYIRNIETPVASSSCLVQLDREHQELRREREVLAARLQNMRREVLQHEKTIEGLTWLVSNLPEHQGRQIVVDTGDSEIDEATMSMMREAEEELMNGDSRSILNLDRSADPEEPALPDSPRGVGPVL